MTKAAMTMGSNISISEVSEKINKLAHSFNSLDTKSVKCSWSTGYNSGSHQHDDQVANIVPISLGHTVDVISIDGPDTLDLGSTALEGHNPEGLVLTGLLVS